MYEAEVSKDAARTLRRMPHNTARLIIAKIEQLATDPHVPNNNVKALVGRPGYRLRVGDWRVIYDLDDGLRILAPAHPDHRAYRSERRSLPMAATRKVRYIEERGKRYAMVPAETYERMLDDLDMLDDIRTYDAARAKLQEFIPLELTKRLIAGENAVKAWRTYRALTQQHLAEAAGISTPYLSQIENGLREPSVDVLKRLAAVLAVEVDDLV